MNTNAKTDIVRAAYMMLKDETVRLWFDLCAQGIYTYLSRTSEEVNYPAGVNALIDTATGTIKPCI